MEINKKFNLEKQEILSGSRILKNNKTKNRIDYFYDHAEENYLVKNSILDKYVSAWLLSFSRINN